MLQGKLPLLARATAELLLSRGLPYVERRLGVEEEETPAHTKRPEGDRRVERGNEPQDSESEGLEPRTVQLIELFVRRASEGREDQA